MTVSRSDMAGRNLPLNCGCDEKFLLSHAVHCGKGDFTDVRHKEIRATFENLVDEICFAVEVELTLQPLQEEAINQLCEKVKN